MRVLSWLGRCLARYLEGVARSTYARAAFDLQRIGQALGSNRAATRRHCEHMFGPRAASTAGSGACCSLAALALPSLFVPSAARVPPTLR